jgi:histidine triad (HIT) family protein
MERTIFHKILDKEVPADIVYDDADVLVFRDIHPKAAVHLLFVPKAFVRSIIECKGDHAHLPGMLVEKARIFAEEKGISGYKLQFNVGPEGGQEVPYLHLHFLSDTRV